LVAGGVDFGAASKEIYARNKIEVPLFNGKSAWYGFREIT
jgi:hypothetical protein